MDLELLFTVKIDEEKPDYGLFVFEPLEQGYGHTLGVSLRRVLLTSLPGTAITEVKIDRVKHPFSSMPGVKEDVVRFLLNLKKVRIAYDGKTEVKLTLEKKGKGVVKAGDIKTPANVKIINPDLVLATLADSKSQISAELKVEKGRGYSEASERKTGTVGVLVLDALFSPVVRVNYKVEATRVGRLTNYDKLILEVWTDGTLKPLESIKQAANILSSYFNQIVSPQLPAKVAKPKTSDSVSPNVASLSVEELNIPARVANALVAGGYETVGDILSAERQDLMKVRNMGEKSLKIVSAAIGEHGVQLPTK